MTYVRARMVWTISVVFLQAIASLCSMDYFTKSTLDPRPIRIRALLAEDDEEDDGQAPPPPLLYGPQGINDPFFSSEGKKFELAEEDDQEYLREVEKWKSNNGKEIRVNRIGSASQDSRDGSRKKINVFFKGEFGYELMVVLPFAYYHFLNGSLGRTVSCGDESFSLFYWFSPEHRSDKHCSRDDYKNNLKPYSWRRGLHKSYIPRDWFPPPLAEHFREWGKVWPEVESGSPLVIISNKISDEWKRGPLNFFDLDELELLVSRFVRAGYFVAYNRPGDSIVEDQWQADSKSLRFDDYKLIRKLYLKAEFRGKVRLMQDIQHDNPGASFNEVQLRMMARSRCFISVQGGNSILSSYFGGHNVIYARLGFEVDYNTYKRHYPRLSGAKIHLARSYYRVGKYVSAMISRNVCDSI